MALYNGTNSNIINGFSSPRDWYFKQGGTKYAYNNGVASTTTTYDWNSLALTSNTPFYPSGGSLVNIGTDGYSTGRGFNGYMIEMIGHNTTMSTTDLTAFHTNRLLLNNYNINNSNLINYYPFDTDLNDYKTGAAVSNVTTIGGAAIVTTNTKLTSGSLYLNNASSQALQIPNMTIAAGGFSSVFWIKFITGGLYSRIFDFGFGTSGSTVVCVYQNTSGSTLQIGFYILNPSSGTGQATYTGFSLSDTNWHHLGITISSSGQWTLYIDGVGNTTSVVAYPSTSQITTAYIGKSNASNDPYATMYLNQFLIFNRTLTAREITTIATYPTSVTFTSAPSY
jgi:hypothetical protein